MIRNLSFQRGPSTIRNADRVKMISQCRFSCYTSKREKMQFEINEKKFKTCILYS